MDGVERVIGCFGGGQLGRMLAVACAPLGARVRFLDPKAGAVAMSVGEGVVGGFEDRGAVGGLVEGVSAVTFEFESVPAGALEMAGELVGDAGLLRPGVASLRAAQDRVREKRLFEELGIPTAGWREVRGAGDLCDAGVALGYPLVVKMARGGYDGKGQWRMGGADEAGEVWAGIEAAVAGGEAGVAPAIAESLVGFEREVSVAVTRGVDGSMVALPAAENVHEGGILRRSVAPAPGLSVSGVSAARGMAERLASSLGHVGTLCVEFFDCGAGGLLANEFAPRVHNSAHWSIEGCVVSQFERHGRAVLGLPLGFEGFSPGVVCAGMVNLIGSLPEAGLLAEVNSRMPGGVMARAHVYGKRGKPGRKVGHVTVAGGEAGAVLAGLGVVEGLVSASSG